jgi:hypothetical protein
MVDTMGLGNDGVTCAEAIRQSLRPGELATYSDLYGRVSQKGAWKPTTIRRHLMSCVVNLPPARDEWPIIEPFL